MYRQGKQLFNSIQKPNSTQNSNPNAVDQRLPRTLNTRQTLILKSQSPRSGVALSRAPKLHVQQCLHSNITQVSSAIAQTLPRLMHPTNRLRWEQDCMIGWGRRGGGPHLGRGRGARCSRDPDPCLHRLGRGRGARRRRGHPLRMSSPALPLREVDTSLQMLSDLGRPRKNKKSLPHGQWKFIGALVFPTETDARGKL